MNIFRGVLIALCLGFLNLGLALEIPTKPGQYINDYAHLLSPATVNTLNGELSNFEKSTSNQIVYAIFPSSDNQDIEDFTTRLEDQWRIGQKGKDNGILVVIFVKEHQVRIEVGYGLEGVVPDALAMQIIQNDITPNFKAGKYDAGVNTATAALMQATQDATATPVSKKSPDSVDPIAFLEVLGGLFIIYLMVSIWLHYYVKNNPVKSAPTKTDLEPADQPIQSNTTKHHWFIALLIFVFKLLFYALLFGGGRGGSGGGFGGGFGGGGGGRSGGGGASGRW